MCGVCNVHAAAPRPLFLLLLLLATSSARKRCRTSEDEPEPPVFRGQPIPTGERVRMPQTAGLEWQLFLPAGWRNATSEPLFPVVVFFHGSGDGHFTVMNSQSLPRLLSGDQSTCFDHDHCWRLDAEYERVAAKAEAPASSGRAYLDQEVDLRSPLAACDFASTFPAIVVMPQGWLPAHRTGWTRGKTLQVERLTQHVLSTYRGDPTRVVLSGQSAGGAGAWKFAAAKPELWSALNPICMPAPASIAPRLAGLNVWVVGWAGDGEHGNDAVVAALKVQAAKAPAVVPSVHLGASVRYTRYDKAPGPPDPLYRSMLNHASYDLIYRDPRLWEWAFAKRNLQGEEAWRHAGKRRE